MGTLLLPGSLILYIIGIFLATAGTVYRSAGGRRAAAAVFLAAWVVHLAAIVRLVLLSGRFTIGNAGEYLLVLSWAVLTLYLLLWARWRVHVAGLVLPPIAALMGFGALQLLQGRSTVEEPRHHGWFLFHTTVATVGMAILCVAFAMSLIYLIQDRALKSKQKLRLLERLPTLDSCDRIGYVALWLGFVLLTLGIVTGVAGNAAAHNRWILVDAKQTLPLLAWILFAGILFSRVALGVRGRKSAYLTIAGFALGVLNVVGMTL